MTRSPAAPDRLAVPWAHVVAARLPANVQQLAGYREPRRSDSRTVVAVRVCWDRGVTA